MRPARIELGHGGARAGLVIDEAVGHRPEFADVALRAQQTLAFELGVLPLPLSLVEVTVRSRDPEELGGGRVGWPEPRILPPKIVRGDLRRVFGTSGLDEDLDEHPGRSSMDLEVGVAGCR